MKDVSGPPSLLSFVKLNSSRRSRSPHHPQRASSGTRVHPKPGTSELHALELIELPRTDTTLSTVSDTQRQYGLRAKISEIFHRNYSTVRSVSLRTHRRKVEFDLRRWPNSSRNFSEARLHRSSSQSTTLPTSDTLNSSMVTNSTPDLTARQFAQVANMKVKFLSDLEEERTYFGEHLWISQEERPSIMDPKFFLSPFVSSPISSSHIAVSSLDSLPSNNVLLDTIIDPSSNLYQSETETSRFEVKTVLTSNSVLPGSTTSTPQALSGVRYVKIGRFLVSVDQPDSL